MDEDTTPLNTVEITKTELRGIEGLGLVVTDSIIIKICGKTREKELLELACNKMEELKK